MASGFHFGDTVSRCRGSVASLHRSQLRWTGRWRRLERARRV